MAQSDLARRLGHPEGARLLIVNCDDFGSSHAANVAIVRSLDEGIATSATLMAPCPWAREAAQMSVGRDVGVHLTLTAEYPFYRWRSLTGAASLRDAEGFLPKDWESFAAQARVEDVRAECRAQIEQALQWGVDVTHLDSHMGCLQLEERFFDVYLEVAEIFALPLRMVSRSWETRIGFPGRARAAAAGILFTDHVIDPWGADAGEVLKARLPRLAEGVTETWAHPVEDGPELRGYDLDAADVRAADANTLLDAGLKSLISEGGIVPISYRPLRAVQRSASALPMESSHR